jgi:hypothetical protein
MRLSAVMSLMVEKMIERGREFLLNLHRANDGAVADRAGQIGFAKRVDVAADALVLGHARATQRGEAVVEDRAETSRVLARAGEPLHPDAVAKHR